MPARDRLVFLLRDDPNYVDASGWSDTDLSRVPRDTISLNLENSSITDRGILCLPHLPALRCLDLDSTHITDAAMRRISQFGSLEELWIESTAISDDGMAYLHSLVSLKFVSVAYCAISPAAIERLRSAIPGIVVH